ncbi:MAG: hypothetical protein JO295_09360 [Verrucomicrobia bacterium]|nr:hypothetical protein [Verrucomicrobiota bacterium]
MKTLARSVLLLALLVTGLLPATRLHAQASKIFVASYGNDANDGSRGSPKRDFQPAHDAVALGGQIVVLDTAGYGALNIAKSVTITVPPGVNGFVTVANSATAITINTTTTGDVVTLRGLIIEDVTSDGLPFGGSYGVNVLKAGIVNVENCTVRNFAYGINLATANAATLNVFGCDLLGNGYGVAVQATTAVTLAAVVADCRFVANDPAVYTNTTNASGNADVTVNNSVFSRNGDGLYANGATTIRVSNSSITGGTGGGVHQGDVQKSLILSRGNNTLEKNASANTFPGTYSAK